MLFVSHSGEAEMDWKHRKYSSRRSNEIRLVLCFRGAEEAGKITWFWRAFSRVAKCRVIICRLGFRDVWRDRWQFLSVVYTRDEGLGTDKLACETLFMELRSLRLFGSIELMSGLVRQVHTTRLWSDPFRWWATFIALTKSLLNGCRSVAKYRQISGILCSWCLLLSL